MPLSIPLSPEAALGDPARARLLVVTKRRATGLLGLMVAVFLAAVLLGEDRGLLGFVRAGAEASLVGGLADWFAVTALFRHPLGLPIPHTAVIPERKDQFGRTLGRFVQESLLTPALITERVRNARIARRVADWLADEGHAAVLAGYIADALHSLAGVVEEEDVERLIEEGLRRAVDRVEPAGLGAKALTSLMAAGYHQEAFDAVLRGTARFLDEHREDLQARFLAESPWWRPGAIDRRIFTRLLDGALHLLDEIVADPAHPLRGEVDTRLSALVRKLETSAPLHPTGTGGSGGDPGLRARIARAKDELLAQGHLPQLAASLWRDARATLAEQAADPGSELRTRLAGALAAAGQRLGDDPVLLARADQLVESVATYVAEHFHGEIGSVVDTAISRWDGEETARRLELLLGPDLQFIRINGTVIGGLTGVGIHAVEVLLR
ncbi:MAG TPA: DUF445 domain-containing protein [Acidimicrobiia bacterium]|nr:DUF445 domain-containing protein [Acidimicrobiia bacterium]